MKKTLVTALTTALVVGAASTTFAAANPFSDVPANHWAYDAVSQLAADGIINGYGDGMFNGDQNMTRYEMAQIVAKALAHRTTAPAIDKGMIDKLQAEFSDELSNLGVRVAALEKKTDNLKWAGSVQYQFVDRNQQDETVSGSKGSGNRYRAQRVAIQLKPSMKINKTWTAKSTFEATMSTNAGMNGVAGVNRDGYSETYTHVQDAYVEGKLGKYNVKLGRFATGSVADDSMVLSNRVTGAQVTIPAGAVKVQLAAGRYARNANADNGFSGDEITLQPDNYAANVFTYIGADITTNLKGKFNAGVGYRQLRSKDNLENGKAGTYLLKPGENSELNILSLGMNYKFNKNIKATVDYATNVNAKYADNLGSWKKNSYEVKLAYKGAKASQKGSFGFDVAYQQHSNANVINGTHNFTARNQKGFNFGLAYALDKNVLAKADFFTGKNQQNDKNLTRLNASLQFAF